MYETTWVIMLLIMMDYDIKSHMTLLDWVYDTI